MTLQAVKSTSTSTRSSSLAHLVEVDGVAIESAPERGRALRDTFGCFPSGVTAVCAELPDGERVGMAVSSFTSVSLDPPLVSVCIDLQSTTWERLRPAPRLGVSVLAAEHAGAARRLASRSGDRFADLPVEPTEDGALFLHGASAWFDCSVEAELPAGDHLIVLLRVHRHHAGVDAAPLVFHRSSFGSLA
ncbi:MULTISPECIES: flavin reductase family protein [unclassified Nocardioides]|uniref:flavin reductase family protein n=1 Tax=unclassified Nocardioides TaxID=2615069 RepID=UPI00301539E9